jgi:hypothetical protein
MLYNKDLFMILLAIIICFDLFCCGDVAGATKRF